MPSLIICESSERASAQEEEGRNRKNHGEPYNSTGSRSLRFFLSFQSLRSFWILPIWTMLCPPPLFLVLRFTLLSVLAVLRLQWAQGIRIRRDVGIMPCVTVKTMLPGSFHPVPSHSITNTNNRTSLQLGKMPLTFLRSIYLSLSLSLFSKCWWNFCAEEVSAAMNGWPNLPRGDNQYAQLLIGSSSSRIQFEMDRHYRESFWIQYAQLMAARRWRAHRARRQPNIIVHNFLHHSWLKKMSRTVVNWGYRRRSCIVIDRVSTFLILLLLLLLLACLLACIENSLATQNSLQYIPRSTAQLFVGDYPIIRNSLER